MPKVSTTLSLDELLGDALDKAAPGVPLARIAVDLIDSGNPVLNLLIRSWAIERVMRLLRAKRAEVELPDTVEIQMENLPE